MKNNIHHRYISADPDGLDCASPTRRCLVCDEYENPLAKIIVEEKAYLCPKCKGVLGFLVEETITGGRENEMAEEI